LNRGLSFGPNQQISMGTFMPGVGYDPAANPTYMGDYNDVKTILSSTGRGSDFLFAWTDCRRVVETLSGRHPDQDVFFTRMR
jgi:hypothetical protein